MSVSIRDEMYDVFVYIIRQMYDSCWIHIRVAWRQRSQIRCEA